MCNLYSVTKSQTAIREFTRAIHGARRAIASMLLGPIRAPEVRHITLASLNQLHPARLKHEAEVYMIRCCLIAAFTFLGSALACAQTDPAPAELDRSGAALQRATSGTTERSRAAAALLPIAAQFRQQIEIINADATDPAYETMLDAPHLANSALRAATRDLLAAKRPIAEAAMSRVDEALAATRAALLTLRGTDPRSEQYRVADGAIDAINPTRARYAVYFAALAAYLRESAELVAFLSTPEADPRLTTAGTLKLRSNTAVSEFNRRADRLDVSQQALQRTATAIASARDTAAQQLESLSSR